MIQDTELRNLYQTTSTERLQKLQMGLLQLEQGLDNAVALGELHYELHSLKGDSRSLGLDAIAALAEQLDEIVKTIQQQAIAVTLEVNDSLYQGIDTLGQLIEEAITGESATVNLDHTLDLLENVLDPTAASLPAGAAIAIAAPAPPPYIEDSELREIYAATSEGRLQTLETCLHQLDQESLNEDTLALLRRETHSLKGDSRAVGLDTIAGLAQSLEDITKDLQQRSLTPTPTVIHCLQEGVQVIRVLVTEATLGEPSGVNIEDVVERLITTIAAVTVTSPMALPASVTQPENITAAITEPFFDAATIEVVGEDASGVEAIASEPTIIAPDAVNAPDAAAFAELGAPLAAIEGTTLDLAADVVVTAAADVNLKQLTPTDDAHGKPQTVGSSSEQPVAADVDAGQTAPITTRQSLIDDDELREIYRTTSEERLQQLEASLLHLEKNPDDGATFAVLMREAHSLKGDSRSTGVDAVAVLAHAAEDVLTALQRQQVSLTTVSDRLYQSFDAIALLVQEAVTGEPANVNTPQLLQSLRATLPQTAVDIEGELATITKMPTSAKLATVEPKEDSGLQLDTVRVQTRALDALMTQAEELAVTRIQITQTTSQTEQLFALWEEWRAQKQNPSAATTDYEEQFENLILTLRSTVQENSNKLEIVAEDLRDRVRQLQLLPLSILFQSIPRAVRDLAKQQAKEVDLVLEGRETTADKRLIEGIRDSLMHLVRNALDHGIEAPNERIAAGKPPTATLRVKAYQTPLSLVLEIVDDGRGLDLEQIKRTALKRGLYNAAELALMSDNQIQQIILTPGFSTRSFITEVSGRGVGLDVLRTQVEQLKGSIQIDSTPGQGCVFRLQLSTALSTANVVIVEVQGITFAVPIEFLQMTLLVTPNQVTAIDGQDTLLVDDEPVPVADLATILELAESPVYPWATKPSIYRRDRRPCILLKVGDEQAGFFVDRLVDQQEVVSKPLNPLLKRVRNVTAATLLGTGDICMILNPPDLLKSLQRQTLTPTPSVSPKQSQPYRPRILLVEDSPPVRIQEKRLFEEAGYDVVTATNGAEGYEMLNARDFDAIVSDIEMPHLDGLALVTKIRQQPQYKELPIILVTTLDSDEDRQRGADAGANAYILKGRFNQEALLETLATLI